MSTVMVLSGTTFVRDIWLARPNPTARLTDAEKQALIDGAEKSLGPQAGPEKH
jgi:hypothetical protein